MTWMLTATGATVDLTFMAGEAISLLDIAHHLAQINRHAGACRRPYSVAEHSLLVCEIVERVCGERSPHILLAALMHDAHEAYTCDLSAPMKRLVGGAWHAEEARIEHAVRKRFGLLTAFAAARKKIAWADLTARSTEIEQLLPASGPEAACIRTHPPIGWWRFSERDAFGWEDWRQAFMDRFAALQYHRGLIADAGAVGTDGPHRPAP